MYIRQSNCLADNLKLKEYIFLVPLTLYLTNLVHPGRLKSLYPFYDGMALELNP